MVLESFEDEIDQMVFSDVSEDIKVLDYLRVRQNILVQHRKQLLDFLLEILLLLLLVLVDFIDNGVRLLFGDAEVDQDLRVKSR